MNLFRTLLRRGLSAAALLALAALGAAQPAAAATQWVMGYYVAYQRDMYPPQSIGWGGLTHIMMGRVKAKADGTLNLDFDWDTTHGPALAKDIAKRAHAAGKKAILMVGGADEGATIRAAVVNHRAAFVANLVAAMNSLGYDGLDLDWEDSVDWAKFQSLVTDLRAAAPNAILTAPMAAININYETVDSHVAAIAAKLDRISLMTYAPATVWAGAGSGWLSWFNAPLAGEKETTPVSIASSLQRYVAAGVPKSKLAMGTSFYAICYTGGVTGPNQSAENGVAIRGGDNDFPLSKFYGKGGVFDWSRRFWNARASQSYLSLPTAESHGCRYVSYEDESALLAKGAYSRQNGYGGVIVWTINQGYVTSHSRPNFLLEALRKGFIDPNAAQTVGLSVMQGDVSLAPGAQRRFSALVTGTTNKSVTWSIVETGCGAIDGAGRYTAPSTQKTCTVTAKSVADRSKTASAKVTVSAASWTPSFSVSRSGTWWVEVLAKDASAASMSIQWPDGTSSPLSLEYRQYGTNYPVFAANYEFPDAGGSYYFTAKSTSNRTAKVKLKVPACAHGADGVCH
ncbi:glycoside hydrolase family 18 protein [Methylosinus sp. Sm6]|uniref:glycosyl hydrolase family 18 protein n=1 Tax=Methylosinus sp. Sm6 TaxID=2866948 RepID=UPI001C98FA28|nr:glycoside hydrolase family 18 protein [Methylosinus sp. Sm6]MBY6243822.1 glycoside hydrolase family 18 protein [Methylosinus sp. Sm6]